MSDRAVMIPLPDSAPPNFEQTFNTQEVGESLVWEYLILHYTEAKDEQSYKDMVGILETFLDETLWRILEYRIPYLLRKRNRDLLEKGSFSDEENNELDDYSELYGRFMLMRSKALLCLKQRGYDIDRFLEEQFL